jgi:putative ABC transport system permease protein
VVRRVLIAPLPYRAPDQLFRFYTTPASDGDDDRLSAVELSALATNSKSLAGVTLFGNYGSVTYTDDHTAEPWQTVQVATNFFDVLGVRPLFGRQFQDDDLAAGAQPVIMLSYPLWRRVFGDDQKVLGRKIQINSVATTVIGVLPPSFVGPTFKADALLPLNLPGVLRSAQYSRSRAWRSVGRLRTDVTPAALESELALLRGRIAAQYPEIRNAGVFRPVPLHGAMVGAARPVLLLVMGGAALVLVITCVNIAGLFLSRAGARRRELGVRAALGAGRGRLIRQVVTETSLYGLGGGAAGVALAFAMKRAFVDVAGSILPQMGEIRIDVGVLVFAAAVSLACGLAFGFMPALAATRIDLRDALGDSGMRAASQGRSHVRGTRALVSAQIALAIVLLVGAGLLLRTFVTLVRTNLGYAADSHVLTFHVNLPAARYRDADARAAFLHRYLDRIRALPGVKSAGKTLISPWNGPYSVGFQIEGRPVDPNDVPRVEYVTATDGFFATVGIPIRAGRDIQPGDRTGAVPVVVISQSVAHRFWPNASPIGARVLLNTGSADSAVARTVVGVVGDVRPSVTEDVLPTVYVSDWQTMVYGGEIVVRTVGDASAVIEPAKRALLELDPKLPLLFPRTLREILTTSIARQQLAMALMGTFAALALVLATLGVYGVMAYAVTARTREFGIRSALGAGRKNILVLVLRQGVATTVLGVVCGLGVAALASRFVASLLAGVSAHDPLTFVAAPLLLVAVALAACMLPARTATRVQPAEALRVE